MDHKNSNCVITVMGRESLIDEVKAQYKTIKRVLKVFFQISTLPTIVL